MEHEEAELLPELAVVALLGFLETLQIRVELRLGEEGGAVHALHRLILRVALPVRVRRGQQLERLEPARWRHVRSDTEVDEEVAVLDRVAGDVRLAGRLLLDELHLQRLAALGEEVDRFLARPHLPLVREIGGGELAHLRFDALQILGHERLLDDEVVEEPIVGGGADAALDAGIELRDGGGEQMRRRVAIERERVGALRRHDRGRARRRRAGRTDRPDGRRRRRQGPLREPRRDGRCDSRGGCARGHAETGAVRKCDRDFCHRRASNCGRSPGRGRARRQVGRREWSRTTDLLRVKQAL